MHTCPPPIDELEERFEEYPGDYGRFAHTLLVQREIDDGSLIEVLVPYFESAHLDARTKFHEDTHAGALLATAQCGG